MDSIIIQASDLDGSNGFIISGINTNDQTGFSVSAAGDFNGDGIGDLIIGAPAANAQNSLGKSYVVFGQSTGFNASLDLATLDGSNGFVLNGVEAGDYSGFAVSSADVNGDGFDDVIIGSSGPYFNAPGAKTHVVFGQAGPFSANVDLSDLDGSNGFLFNGNVVANFPGTSVRGAGDINGDGLEDVIIGASGANDDVGESYVIFGQTEAFSASFGVSDLNGSNGFVINGTTTRGNFGWSVSGAGDVNGDGFDDLIIGAISGGRGGRGRSHIVFGQAAAFAPTFDITSLNGTNGFVLTDGGSFSVSSAGDINNDGFDDFVVGARDDGEDGRSYVIFGDAEIGASGSLSLTALNGSNGFAINGSSTFSGESGYSVSGIGDVNGDGIDDLLIGDPSADPDNGSLLGILEGQSYVVFGRTDGFSASLDLAALSGDEGFVIDGTDAYDNLGFSVSGAGDVNGDGINDIIVGAPGADVSNGQGSEVGEGYVIFGNAAPQLDLNGGSTGINFEAVFEGNAVAIANHFNLSLTDPNNTSLVGATIEITNAINGAAEGLAVDTQGTNITASYDAETGTLTLTGEDTVTQYQQALRTLTYNNSVANANTTDRLIEVTVDDGGAFSNVSAIATATVTFAPDLPNLLPNATDDNITTANSGPITIDLLANDSDPNADAIKVVEIDTSNTRGAVSLNDEGTVTYNPPPAFAAIPPGISLTDSFGYTIEDDLGGQSTATATLTVAGSTIPSTLDLANLNGNNGFTINGVSAEDYTGHSVSSAGDINGDGFDDVIIGESEFKRGYSDRFRSGKSYVVFGNQQTFEPALDLSNLDGSNGFVLDGIAVGPRGLAVSDAGDINGDGLDDLLIGAPNAGPNPGSDGAAFSGQAYVVFGTTEGFAPNVDLPGLNGQNGFIINSMGDYDLLGTSVSNAGDVNGDGIDDLIVGPLRSDQYYSGESYVIFGRTEGFSSTLSLADLNGNNGFIINSNGRELYDASVSSARDINGDGIDDVVIGAPNGDPNDLVTSNGIGQSFVVFGSSEDFSTRLNVDDLNGSNGFVLNGFAVNGEVGTAVGRAGDINGDGIEDLAIGAPETVFLDGSRPNRAGQTYIIFGTTAGFASDLSLADLDGSNGFTINGTNSGDMLGTSVSSAGDINGDGIEDLLLGAPNGGTRANSYGYGRRAASEPGTSYVIFGDAAGFDASLDVADLDGSNGLKIPGIAAGDGAGESVSSAGDIDGDGLDDLIIGAPFAGPSITRTISTYDGSTFETTYSNSRGESYVIFGNVAPELDLNGSESGIDFVTTFDGSRAASLGRDLSLSDNKNRLIGATVFITNPVDSEAEVLAAQVEGTNISATYAADSGILTLSGEDTIENYRQVLQTVTYSNTSNNPDTTDRTIQFVVNDGSHFNNFSTVATATITFESLNQIDGTNTNDQLVGTRDADRIIGFGGNDFITGRSGNDRLAGRSGNDRVFGEQGNDILNGNRGDDLLNGGSGNDLLRAGKGKDKLFGSRGDDILQGHDGDDFLSGGLGNDSLNGGSGLDLLSGGSGDDFLKGFKGDDRLFGGVGDDTLRGGNGVDLLQGGQGNDRLDGGFGDDSLFGGAGVDQFVLRAGDGKDTIFDYQDGIDSLGLDGLDFTDLEILQGAGQTTIQIQETQKTLAILQNVQASIIEDTDFTVLT
ncbi:Leukotoxin [Acaryochloris thomasi RCC1774]|uniref:Leukotoxin n=1 Tax=Acaryochloris thomasi RCC1774 TaxID=1764569 RepID=A0A2W1JIT9_9CYAN|nr:Ig-like domain-containing protein [Acaryochloris thomasi]PZD73390.1 Leukotoxin [Acaryochloris thomasi RCC1774]